MITRSDKFVNDILRVGEKRRRTVGRHAGNHDHASCRTTWSYPRRPTDTYVERSEEKVGRRIITGSQVPYTRIGDSRVHTQFPVIWLNSATATAYKKKYRGQEVVALWPFRVKDVIVLKQECLFKGIPKIVWLIWVIYSVLREDLTIMSSCHIINSFHFSHDASISRVM